MEVLVETDEMKTGVGDAVSVRGGIGVWGRAVEKKARVVEIEVDEREVEIAVHLCRRFRAGGVPFVDSGSHGGAPVMEGGILARKWGSVVENSLDFGLDFADAKEADGDEFVGGLGGP